MQSQQEEALKTEVHDYWNAQPCGTQFTELPPGTKEFFDEVERFRYATQPFMERLCGFKKYRGKKLLEIGCGLGTDSLQFARNGAIVTGIDLTEEGPRLAKQRFDMEGLRGEFLAADAENLPFADNTFDVVFSFGVLHHTPDTQKAVNEVYRVLKPGGEIVIMLYHKHSLHTWIGTPLFFLTGLANGKIRGYNDWVRVYDGTSNPLGKAYSRSDARKLFSKFKGLHFAICDSYRRKYPKWLNSINQSLFAPWAGFWMMIYGKK
jgi:ubiquinone/menaquinone biosynthesis C-methylase UbiE